MGKSWSNRLKDRRSQQKNENPKHKLEHGKSGPSEKKPKPLKKQGGK